MILDLPPNAQGRIWNEYPLELTIKTNVIKNPSKILFPKVLNTIRDGRWNVETRIRGQGGPGSTSWAVPLRDAGAGGLTNYQREMKFDNITFSYSA